MIKIKSTDTIFDYELEDGTFLHSNEWNGEDYTVHENGKETVYKPVYRFQEEEIDIDTLEENSEEWTAAVEILGFDKW